MPYYKDSSNGLHHLDDESQEFLLPAGTVRITDAEAHAIQNPAPTTEQLIAGYAEAVQAHMESAARNHGYDSLLSAVSYADESSVPKFQAEGMAFRAWRSQVWASCHALLGKVQAGEASPPTKEQLLAQLPELKA